MEIKKLLFATLFSTSNRLQTIGDTYLGDVSTKQWFLLACVKFFGSENPTLSQLSPLMGSSRQNIKQLALKLETKGFLTLFTDPQDSRAIRLSITPTCDTYWKKREKQDEAFISSLFSGLSDEELTTATKVLQKLEQNMHAMQKDVK